jgi:hypothetical protein
MFSWGESLMFLEEKEPPKEEQEQHIVTEGSGVVTESISENEERRLLNESFMDGRRDVLCKVSTSREIYPGGGSATIMPAHYQQVVDSYQKPWYSIRLGSKGLQKIQSHYALEADHCGFSQGEGSSGLAADSPTSSLRSAVERYTSYMESQREMDLSDEETPLLSSFPSYISRKYFHFRGKAKALGSRLKTCLSNFAQQTFQVLLRLGRAPALQASLAAVVLASFPGLKQLFISPPHHQLPSTDNDDGSQPPLYFVYDAVSTLGQAQVPVSMIMLSGTATLRFMKNLRRQAVHAVSHHSGGDTKQRVFSWKVTGLILTGRTLIMPLVGLGWWCKSS